MKFGYAGLKEEQEAINDCSSRALCYEARTSRTSKDPNELKMS